jgi:hypothetical protein
MGNQLVLRLRGAHLIDNNFFMLFVVVMVVMIFLTLPAMTGITYDQLNGFYSSLEADNLKSLIPIISMLFGILLAGYFLRIALRSQILIDETGIIYESRLPEALKFIRPDWRCRWDEIQGAVLQTGTTSHVLAQQLFIKALNSTHTLMPWQWVDEANQPSIWKMQVPQGEAAEAAFQQTALLVLFRDKALLKESLAGDVAKDDFDSDPRVVTIVALFIGLIAYFIFDQYFGIEEFYASTPPYHWMAGLGVVVTVVAFKFLPEDLDLAARVRLIAVLLGVGVALASHPLLLRANAYTDEAGLQAYEYELVGDGRWEAAVSAEVPDLIFDIGSPYWDQFELGARKEYEIRQGGLGFAQVNMAPLYAEQRHYYESR